MRVVLLWEGAPLYRVEKMPHLIVTPTMPAWVADFYQRHGWFPSCRALHREYMNDYFDKEEVDALSLFTEKKWWGNYTFEVVG